MYIIVGRRSYLLMNYSYIVNSFDPTAMCLPGQDSGHVGRAQNRSSRLLKQNMCMPRNAGGLIRLIRWGEYSKAAFMIHPMLI